MKQQGDATLKTTMVVSYIGWLVVLFFSGNAIAESTTDQQYQAAMSPPGTVGWGPRYATPGVVLTLREIFNSRGSRVAGYKLEASGFPIDKIYNLWMHSLGKVMDGDDASLYRIEDAPAPPYEYHINAWGKLIPANEFTILLDVYKFAKFTDGEWFGIALISTDRSVKGYAEVIPRPIEATKGTCRIWLKRVTLHSYLVSGEGFEPGEEVTAISRFRPSLLSRSKTIESKHTVLSDGHLPTIVIRLTAEGKRYGKASYTVIGKSCNLTVRYRKEPAGQRAFATHDPGNAEREPQASVIPARNRRQINYVELIERHRRQRNHTDLMQQLEGGRSDLGQSKDTPHMTEKDINASIKRLENQNCCK